MEPAVNVMTPAIVETIRSSIIAGTRRREYDRIPPQISAVLAELHAGIPDTKRTSYGIVYTVRLLSQYLYTQLAQTGAPVQKVANAIYAQSVDTKPRSVALGMMSFLGPDGLKDTLSCFETAAASPDWEMREMAQGLFRRLVGKYPNDVRGFLHRLSLSPDANLRRFVAETLRPVQENRWLYQDPEYSLSILRSMFQERAPYPRTSVGNNLSDLARRLPELVCSLVKELVESGDANSRWIAHRACRNLVKSDPIRVMDLLRVDEYQYKKRVYRRSDYQRD
jgi:3-methyladenine DNA glycosylase AlkC